MVKKLKYYMNWKNNSTIDNNYKQNGENIKTDAIYQSWLMSNIDWVENKSYYMIKSW